MRRFVVIALGAGVVAMIAWSLLSTRPKVAPDSVLVVELSGSLEEAPPVDPLSRFSARGTALPTLLLQLEMAAVDSRVRAVLLHLRPVSIGYARIQELRAAIERLRLAGKMVVAVLDMQSLNATREYYLASAADKVFVDPGLLAPFAGIAGQYVHLAGLFEKLGIRVEYERVGRFKSAVEMFAEHEMSEPARQMTTAIIDGVFGQIVGGIAESRKLSPERVRELIDAAPGTAEEYVEAGLADGIAGRDAVLQRVGFDKKQELKSEDYAALDPRSVGLRNGPEIALIFGDGNIVQTRSGPLGAGFASDSLAEALGDAAADDDVKAIVLRINSGGGSALASEQVWRAVRKAHEKKPVVVSMADAAASGGYYVASGADAIVAEPATLTGSIGVFMLRPSFAQLYDKLDIGVEVIARGKHAGVAGSDLPLNPEQRARTASYVQATYRDFLHRISEGRGTDVDELDKLGRGYVWLGSAAAENGLVDRLGGLHEAVALAKERAGIAADVDPARAIFPGPRSLGDQLRELFHSELAASLQRALLPFDLPEPLAWAWLARDSELAYLPTHWVEIR
jgi:protease IV